MKQHEKDLLKYLKSWEQKFTMLEEKHTELQEDGQIKLTEKAVDQHIEALNKAIKTVNIVTANVSNLACKYVLKLVS